VSLASGSRLGPYEIVAPIGAGGMGEVYRARDPRLDRDVAIKVLPPSFAADPERLRRFEQEARAAGALNHPHITAVYDIGSAADGSPYVVQELLEGETLRALLAGGSLSSRRAAGLGTQIALGLAAAHAKGVVHRDLKPETLFVTSDARLKILDFGLARRLRPENAGPDDPTSSGDTRPGTVLGTVGYMSPEQLRGLPVDARADLFAFGAVFYEMLSGQRAFTGPSDADVLTSILREDPPALSETAGIPASLAKIVDHCLEKRPEDRFQTARDLSFHLETAMAQGAGKKPAAEPGRSIAVLPFADMSPARDQDYFCEGIAEEILNALAQIHGLKVASRTASFQFKGSGGEIRSIGERLGVETLLEGSLRKSGDKLRITAQLIQVDDGFHLWSRRFDREVSDVFAIQEEIATSIAAALRVVLTEKDRRALARAPTERVDAYDYYLRGRQFFYWSTQRNLALARQMFEKAIELDPSFALAWAGLADSVTFTYLWYGQSPDVLRTCVEAAARAVALAPDLAEARTAHAQAAVLERRYADAEAEFEAAIRLNPSLYEAYYFYGRACFSQGKYDRAVDLFESAARIRPEDYQTPLFAAMAHRALGREPQRLACARHSADAARRHLELNPDDVRALYIGAGALIAIGRKEEGVAWLERALSLQPEEHGVLYNCGCAFAIAGETDRAFDCLGKAIRGGCGSRDWILHDTDLDSIRSDPRFEKLVSLIKPGS
jgi:serine/threonine protein kinase/Tfp pilus assembly protein PilF